MAQLKKNGQYMGVWCWLRS